MLVLAHTNRLRVHLHEFCQRILQTAADGNGSTGGHVFLREFLNGNHACAIHRSTGLAHNHAGRNLALELQGHFTTEGVGLTACSTVTNGNQVNLVLVDKLHQVNASTSLVVLGFMRIDHAMVHELAVLVQNGYLATGTETRVQSKHSLVASRGSQQHILQVLAEHLESFLFGSILQKQAHFAFHAGLQQTFPGVLAHIFQVRLPHRIPLDDLGLQVAYQFLGRDLDRKAENLFLLATAERQHTVARNLGNRLAEVVIILELGFLLFEILLDLGHHDALLFHLGAEVLTEFRIVGHFFGQDVGSTLEGGLRVGQALFFGQVNAGDFFGGIAGIFLFPHQAGERLQAKFLGDGGAGTFLGFVGGVNIFEQRFIFAGLDLGLQFGGQLALFLDALEDGLLAVGQFLQVVPAVADVAEFNFVQGSRLVLAVTGDKGDSAPLIHKFQGLGHAPSFKFQLFSNNGRKIHNSFSNWRVLIFRKGPKLNNPAAFAAGHPRGSVEYSNKKE